MFDVAIVGMGPTGLAAAAALARRGHKVALFEKHPRFYGDPRAGHVDHEIARILASLEAWAPVAEIAVPVTEYTWRNQHGQLLWEFKPANETVSGYHSDYMQFQPVLENAIVEQVKPHPNILFRQGWEAIACAQDAEGVELTLRASRGVAAPAREGELMEIRAAYLIGADGANSFVRNALGVERDDLGFDETWLDIDVVVKRPLNLAVSSGQVCDPARPYCSLPLGKHHHRWEWSLLPGETAEEMLKPEKGWELLAQQGVTPDDVEVLRHILYRFGSKMAQRWHDGRVFLAGDAAHTMPPFMGQGLCSGLRDAMNLVWRIDAVLRGVADPALFDGYQPERYPHTRDWTLISIESGKISCVTDEQKAAERDALFLSGFVPPMPELPYYQQGSFDAPSQARVSGLVGRLGLNASVAPIGDPASARLLEDLFYREGWLVISTAGRPEEHLDAAQRQTLAALRTTSLYIAAAPHGGVDAVDVAGKYGAFFAEQGIEVLVVRPDFYVYAAGALADLPAIVDGMSSTLSLRVPAPQEEAACSNIA